MCWWEGEPRISRRDVHAPCWRIASRVNLFSVCLILWAVMVVDVDLWMSVGGRRSGDAAVTDVTIL